MIYLWLRNAGWFRSELNRKALPGTWRQEKFEGIVIWKILLVMLEDVTTQQPQTNE